LVARKDRLESLLAQEITARHVEFIAEEAHQNIKQSLNS
jgi:hypothetical protein